MMTALRTLPVVLLAGAVAYAAPVPAAPTDDQIKEKAAKLNDLTTEDAMDAKLKELAKDKEGAKRLVAVALKEHEGAKGKDKPYKYNAALVLGKLAQIGKDYKAAKTFFEFCEESATKLDSEKKLALAIDSLMDLAWEQKDYDGLIARARKARELQAETDELKGVQFLSVEREIRATALKGDTAEALKMVDDFRFKKWYASQLKSFIHREAGKYDEAVDALTESGKALEDEEFPMEEQKAQMARRIKYMTCNVYVEAKKIDKAADILKALMKEDPDNSTYPNDLGFIWCDNDLNLKESEELIRKALDLDAKARKKLLDEKKIDADLAKKRNASYVDSLGWVLYKNKKYDEALKLLKEASEDEEEAQHIEIWDHLADVQMALGDAKGAVETWTKALKFDDLGKRDAERRKKVTTKLNDAKKKLDKKDDKKEPEKKDEK